MPIKLCIDMPVALHHIVKRDRVQSNFLVEVGRMSRTAKAVQKELRKYAEPACAEHHKKFFKTGKGEYGAHDKFIGVTVPNSRKVAKKFFAIEFLDIKILLASPIHEDRFVALVILTERFAKNKEERKRIFDFYLDNYRAVNNWDLVDVSSHKIVGMYARENPKAAGILGKYVKSSNLWERRLSIVATWAFIQRGEFDWTMKNAKVLLADKHDLTHKAIGWMLREVWKRDNKIVEEFLVRNYEHVPRTTLRYAIERMGDRKRKQYLNIKGRLQN